MLSDSSRDAPDPSAGAVGARRVARATLAAALLVVAWVPLHRLLDPARTGLAGTATRAAAEASWTHGLFGSLLVLGGAAVLGWFVDPAPIRAGLARWTRRMVAWPAGPVAVTAGASAMVLAIGVARLHFGGLPTSVDAMVQLLHARALLDGSVVLPLPPGTEAAWVVQNGYPWGGGWVSVYPPGHTVVLALGLALGAPWLMGPLALGVAVAMASLAAGRSLPGDPGVARWAALALALSPFLLLLGATHLSHTTAAALAATAWWGALRARDGGLGGGAISGAATGWLVCTRPWTGIVLGAVAFLTAVLPRSRAGAGASPVARGLAFVAAATPFGAALLAWNAAVAGHPLRLGYLTAFGPAHGLGLHDDPWGNAYGPVEALAYTAADFLQLGVHLFQSAVPATVLVALALLASRRLPTGARLLGAWCGAAVVVVAPYWHHGIHLGPRLLYEVGPVWVVATVGAAAMLVDLPTARSRIRGAATWVVVLAAVSALALSAVRLWPPPGMPDRVSAALAEADDDALVFVHGSWASRSAARMAGAGMRRDSVETALRRNDACRVDTYARWRAEPAGPPPPLDFDARTGAPSGLRRVALSDGNVILVDPATAPTPACLREAAADRTATTLELEPLLWRSPPTRRAGPVVVRDLGPEANAAVLAAFPGRSPRVLVGGTGEEAPRLMDYDRAMAGIWGGTVTAAR